MRNKFLFAMSTLLLVFFVVFLLSMTLAWRSIKIFDLGFPGLVENYIVVIFSLASMVKAFVEIYKVEA